MGGNCIGIFDDIGVGGNDGGNVNVVGGGRDDAVVQSPLEGASGGRGGKIVDGYKNFSCWWWSWLLFLLVFFFLLLLTMVLALDNNDCLALKVMEAI